MGVAALLDEAVAAPAVDRVSPGLAAVSASVMVAYPGSAQLVPGAVPRGAVLETQRVVPVLGAAAAACRCAWRAARRRGGAAAHCIPLPWVY
jgi:hypothetical protein